MTNSRQPIPRKKKSATSRRSPRKTMKKAVRTTMPIWLRNVLVAVIVAFFSVAFIISLLGLMLIVGNLVMG